jgi:ABC-type antimicrobial peptide transport system permease subunit
MALVLVHYERRRRELAIRTAVGASRARLVSLLAFELVALLAAGTATAVVAGTWMLHVLPHFQLPGSVDFSRLNLAPDWRGTLTIRVAEKGGRSMV